MKVDALAFDTPLRDVASVARGAEEAGDDGWFTAETSGDPFITVALAAAATERIEVGTAIPVAFSRCAALADGAQRAAGLPGRTP